MKPPARAAALALLFAASALTAAPALADDGDAQFRATTLNLTAQGEIHVAPDMATITLGVNEQAPSAQAAMAANATHMTAVTAALRRQGVADRDIQTSNLNLNPQYQYADGQPPRLTGYQAVNEVSVTVRDLAKLGGVADAVVEAGANQVSGIAFGLSDPAAAEDQARRAAVKALAAKAALYAEATGYRVVRLVNLSEGGGYTPQPPRPLAMMRMAAAAEAPTPVEPGEVQVRIEVTGMYELAGK